MNRIQLNETFQHSLTYYMSSGTLGCTMPIPVTLNPPHLLTTLIHSDNQMVMFNCS